MDNTLDARTLSLYLGCECRTFALGDSGNFKTTLNGVEIRGDGYTPYVYLSDGRTLNADEIKLLLRPLSSMTEEEAIEYAGIFFKDYDPSITKFYNLGHSIAIRYYDAFLHLPGSYEPKQFAWLLSKGFDLFGLIEKGLAIDSTKTVTNGK